MTGGEPRHGRRNNGLYAAEYVVVGDVDPRVGEHLLDVLGLRGIAAYLQPSADQHPVTRLTTLPGRPTDRLYVDRRELATAREYYAKVTGEFADEGPTRDPGGGDAGPGPAGPPPSRTSSEFERTWASIVAGFDATAEGLATWPASEDLDTSGGEPDGTGAVHRPSLPPAETAEDADHPADDPRDSDGPSLLEGLDRFGAYLPDDGDDEDEDYHPPPPPPLPRPAGITIVGVLGVIAGLVFITDPGLLPVTSETAVLLGGLCLIAGVVALIGRLRPGDDDEPDDPDHGAVI